MKSMNEDRFRLELELRAWDLRQSLRRGGQLVIERIPDNLDDMLLAAERQSATNELKRTLLLRQVEVALERLQAGQYGSCINCGQEIPESRLNAVPWAIYCIACQELVDRVQARVQKFQKPAA
jgi:DnaK suppressor protein